LMSEKSDLNTQTIGAITRDRMIFQITVGVKSIENVLGIVS
jgi:hypothetical protein